MYVKNKCFKCLKASIQAKNDNKRKQTFSDAERAAKIMKTFANANLSVTPSSGNLFNANHSFTPSSVKSFANANISVTPSSVNSFANANLSITPSSVKSFANANLSLTPSTVNSFSNATLSVTPSSVNSFANATLSVTPSSGNMFSNRPAFNSVNDASVSSVNGDDDDDDDIEFIETLPSANKANAAKPSMTASSLQHLNLNNLLERKYTNPLLLQMAAQAASIASMSAQNLENNQSTPQLNNSNPFSASFSSQGSSVVSNSPFQNAKSPATTPVSSQFGLLTSPVNINKLALLGQQIANPLLSHAIALKQAQTVQQNLLKQFQNRSVSPQSDSSSGSSSCQNLVMGPDGKLMKKRGRPVLSESDKVKRREFQKQMEAVFKNVGVTSESYSQSTPTKSFTSSPKLSPCNKISPQKKVISAESVMKMPIIRRMIFEYHNKKINRGFARKVVYTMDDAVNRLSLSQINVITDEALKEALLSRHEKMMEKRLLTTMSTEDRECYIKQKAREIAMKKREEKIVLHRKFEDQTIDDLLPIPDPRPVVQIEGVSNSSFGDIVMMTEFLQCFGELFDLSSIESKFTTDNIFKAISRGKEGYSYISSLLCIMLPTVLYDSAMTHYKELGIPLREIPVNYQTAPELARLTLIHQKQDLVMQETTSEDGDELFVGEEKDELGEDLLQKLCDVELWELTSQEMVQFLTALGHRCMASDTLAMHVDKLEETATKMYKERASIKKQKLQEATELKKKKRDERRSLAQKKSLLRNPPGRPKGYSPRMGMSISDYLRTKCNNSPLAMPRKDFLLQNRQKRKTPNEKLEDEKKEEEVVESDKVERMKEQREERFQVC